MSDLALIEREIERAAACGCQCLGAAVWEMDWRVEREMALEEQE